VAKLSLLNFEPALHPNKNNNITNKPFHLPTKDLVDKLKYMQIASNIPDL